MVNKEFLIEQIKNFVSIRDVFDKYVGTAPDMNGRYQCPFNNSEDRKNFGIKHNKMWHCFSCGSSGDQITLVQKLFDLPFTEALLKIAEDFGLATEKDEKMSIRMRIEAQRRQLQREKDKRYARFIERKQMELYDELLEIRDLLEKIIKNTDIDTIDAKNVDKMELYRYTRKCAVNFECRCRLQEVELYLDILLEMPLNNDYEYYYPAFTPEEMHERAVWLVKEMLAGNIKIEINI